MAPLIDPNFNAPNGPVVTGTHARTTYELTKDVTGSITQFDTRVWNGSFTGVGLYPTSRQVCCLMVVLGTSGVNVMWSDR